MKISRALKLLQSWIGQRNASSANSTPFYPSCCVYVRADGTWVFPQNNHGGLGLMVAPAERVEASADAESLGAAVIRALGRSRLVEAEFNDSFTGSTAAKEAGFRSHTDLERGAAHLSVYTKSGVATVFAWAASSDGGYVPAPGAEISRDPTPQAIGAAILQLLPRCVARPSRGRRSGGANAQPAAKSSADDYPISFGYKMCWLAVRGEDAHGLAEALGSQHPEICSWRDGYRRAYAYEGIFIPPAIDEWTLAFGRLPDASQSEFLPLLESLSARFGETFYFGTHRVVEYQAWAHAKDGVIGRAFAWLGERGEFLVNIGQRTPEEVALKTGMEDPDNPPNEETVLALAAEWLLRPTELDDHIEATGPGLFLPHEG